MSILPRKLRRRYAASPLGPPPDPSTFKVADPSTPGILAAVAARSGELLGRPALVCASGVLSVGDHTIVDRPSGWALLGDGLEPHDIGFASGLRPFELLGVETVARGIAAAVKRYERESRGLPDRVIGTDSTGADVYESDLDAPAGHEDIEADYDRYAGGWIGNGADGLDAILDARPAFPGEVQHPDDERSAREAWEARYGEAPRPIRDARDLLISIGDHLASLGLEPDLGGDSLTFLFHAHVHRLDLEDLELRRPGTSSDEMAIRAAGMPLG